MKLTEDYIKELATFEEFEKGGYVYWPVTPQERDEITRLASLGKWAEECAIPLLSQVEPCGDWYMGFHYETQKALAALKAVEGKP